MRVAPNWRWFSDRSADCFGIGVTHALMKIVDTLLNGD
jgi:hypothetical protein